MWPLPIVVAPALFRPHFDRTTFWPLEVCSLHLNSPPHSKLTTPSVLTKYLQFNANSITNKHKELLHSLQIHNIHTTLNQNAFTIQSNASTLNWQPNHRTQSASSPDVSFCSPPLSLRTTWQSVSKRLSDHFPGIITHNIVQLRPKYHKRSFTNYKRPNWLNYLKTLSSISFGSYSSLDAALNPFHRQQKIHPPPSRVTWKSLT